MTDIRPPCPRCGGNRMLEVRGAVGPMIRCPDCVDGKVSIEQLVARWNAVQSLSPNTRIVAVFDAERSVRP